MGSQPDENSAPFRHAYQQAHQHGAPRAVQLIGAATALGCAAAGLTSKRRWLLLAAPAVAWGSAALACLLSPQPALAWVPPWRLLGASARLALDTLWGHAGQPPGPEPTAPDDAGPPDAGANGQSRRARVNVPSPSEPIDPRTLN